MRVVQATGVEGLLSFSYFRGELTTHAGIEVPISQRKIRR